MNVMIQELSPGVLSVGDDPSQDITSSCNILRKTATRRCLQKMSISCPISIVFTVVKYVGCIQTKVTDTYSIISKINPHWVISHSNH